ncbi:MAG: DUF2520 domain-containing protein [Microbacteriaceae bacterium]|nr:DUF2520 domain-containing protein [Burkholderiaceae bacterium]
MTVRIAIMGRGRLGRCLAAALAERGERVVAASARSAAAAATVAGADLVLLTVPDDAIKAVVDALPWRRGQAVVHCSGATELTVLAAAARAGAQVGGFHPLQIFSDPDSADPSLAGQMLAGSRVALEAEPPLIDELQRLARLLGMVPLTLPPGSRAAYHAAASFTASFLLPMLDESVRVWAAVGLPADAALAALLPLARGTLAAASSRGLPGALAGPISRGDVGVVAQHLQALDALGGGHGEFYRELSLRQLRLAQQSGRVSAEALQTLEAVLRCSPSTA